MTVDDEAAARSALERVANEPLIAALIAERSADREDAWESACLAVVDAMTDERLCELVAGSERAKVAEGVTAALAASSAAPPVAVATVATAQAAMEMGDAVVAAFEPLKPKLLAYATKFVRYHDALEVLQDACVRLVAAGGRDPDRMQGILSCSCEAYFHRVVRNLAIDTLRKDKRRAECWIDEDTVRRAVEDQRLRDEPEVVSTDGLSEILELVARARGVLAQRMADGRTPPRRLRGVDQALVAVIVHVLLGLSYKTSDGIYEVYDLLTNEALLRSAGASSLYISGMTAETLNQNVATRRREEIEEILAEALRPGGDDGAAIAA